MFLRHKRRQRMQHQKESQARRYHAADRYVVLRNTNHSLFFPVAAPVSFFDKCAVRHPEVWSIIDWMCGWPCKYFTSLCETFTCGRPMYTWKRSTKAINP